MKIRQGKEVNKKYIIKRVTTLRNWGALGLGIEHMSENSPKVGLSLYLPVPHLLVTEGY